MLIGVSRVSIQDGRRGVGSGYDALCQTDGVVVIRTPGVTPVLHAVAWLGAAIHSGLTMLDGQLDAIFDYFR